MYMFAALLIALFALTLYAITSPPTLVAPEKCGKESGLNTPHVVPSLGKPTVGTPLSSREYDVVVFGATGFTGKLVVEYLKGVRGAKVAMAGRNEAKLNDLKSALGLDFDVIVSSATDIDALSSLAEKTRVLLSLAGPYALYGARVVEACVRSGTNYVDLSGEFFFHRDMLDRYQETAQKTGAKIVVAGGYDSVPFDLGSQLVLRDLDVKPGPQGPELTTVVSLVESCHGWLSGGTLASMIEGIGATLSGVLEGGKSMKHGQDPYIDVPEANDCTRVDTEATGWGYFPRYDRIVEDWGIPHFMAYCNSRVVRRTVHLMRQGRVSYSEGMSFGAMFDATIWAAKEWWKGEIILMPKPGEGPGPGVMKSGGFSVKVVGTRGEEQAAYRITGAGDPGYEFTSKCVATVALCLSDTSCERRPGEGGIFAVGSAVKGKSIRERLGSVMVGDRKLMEFEKL